MIHVFVKWNDNEECGNSCQCFRGGTVLHSDQNLTEAIDCTVISQNVYIIIFCYSFCRFSLLQKLGFLNFQGSQKLFRRGGDDHFYLKEIVIICRRKRKNLVNFAYFYLHYFFKSIIRISIVFLKKVWFEEYLRST